MTSAVLLPRHAGGAHTAAHRVAGVVAALLPLWFLGLAMLLNLLAHPLLAFRAGEYFPGLLTAPLVGIFGGLTVGELARATSNEP